jgi:hypothetical protein
MDSIEQINRELEQLRAQKRQEISRIDKEIKDLETKLEALRTPLVSLDPSVTKQLNTLCDKINKYMQNPEYAYPHSYSTTEYMGIINALSVYRRTTSDMVQQNIRAIAEVMRQRIMFDGDANTAIISCESTDDGLFDIHLSLKSGTKDLRIFSIMTNVNWNDREHSIRIDLTDRLAVNGVRGF